MKRILVPCDFSEPARQAYLFAMNLATQTDADVFVLKVIDLPFYYESSFNAPAYYFNDDLLKGLEAEAVADFDKLKKTHPRQQKVSFTYWQGPVTPTIRQFIDEKNIDLVIMGTRGASGLKEYWIGSNTEKIVRFSPVPVLAIRKSFDIASIKNIVFPTTLELDQPILVSKIKALQEFFKAKLHLLLINTPYNMNRTLDQTNQMEVFVKHYGLKDTDFAIRNDFYEPDGIIGYAHEVKADLVVMGTHARKGLAHLFMGSITEDVVNHVDCPIWTFSLTK
jgi:nucleotide-binding universal stress UspA family protein